MSQSTLGELEWIGQGSAKATQLARRCGVRSEWLSEGLGPMLDDAQHLSEAVHAIGVQVDALPEKWREWALIQIRSAVDVAQQSAAIEAERRSLGESSSPKRSTGGK